MRLNLKVAQSRFPSDHILNRALCSLMFLHLFFRSICVFVSSRSSAFGLLLMETDGSNLEPLRGEVWIYLENAGKKATLGSYILDASAPLHFPPLSPVEK